MISPSTLGTKDHFLLGPEIVNGASSKRIKVLVLLGLSVMLVSSFMFPTYSGFASPENKTLMQPQGVQGIVNKRYKYCSGPWRMG